MSNRFEKRARYIEGWVEMDSQQRLSTTTADFIFDDPVEPGPVTREELVDYMLRWDKRTPVRTGRPTIGY